AALRSQCYGIMPPSIPPEQTRPRALAYPLLANAPKWNRPGSRPLCAWISKRDFQEAAMHHRHEDLGEDLRDQIASLSHEIAAMRKQMMRRGRGAFRDSRHVSEDIVDTVREYLSSAMPDI